jgi:hypothetical protein
MNGEGLGKPLAPRFAVRTADSDSESGELATSGGQFVHSSADRQEYEGSSYEDGWRSDGRPDRQPLGC